jgi:hypothetical protein
MYSAWGTKHSTETLAELSFHDTGAWPIRFGDMANTSVKVGDDTCGPIIGPVACQPGTVPPPAAAHAHASDTFRIILRGTFKMGPEMYGPGEFRFQQGWRPYPGEDALGDDGLWMAVFVADRRGMRARYVKEPPPDSPEAQVAVEMHRYFGRTYELKGGDVWFSDDPKDTAGPSALASSLGPIKSGKRNGSFADADSWTTSHPGTREAVSILGDPICGPVVVLTATEPNGVVTPPCRFDTEVFRMIVAGACEIDGRRYEKGDMRIDRAGEWFGPVVAGPEGMQQVVVIGDRRHATPTMESTADESAIGGVIHELLDELNARPKAEPATV